MFVTSVLWTFSSFFGKIREIIHQLVSTLAGVSLPPEGAKLIESQGEGATESGLRVRTRVTVLSARGGEQRLLRIT